MGIGHHYRFNNNAVGRTFMIIQQKENTQNVEASIGHGYHGGYYVVGNFAIGGAGGSGGWTNSLRCEFCGCKIAFAWWVIVWKVALGVWLASCRTWALFWNVAGRLDYRTCMASLVKYKSFCEVPKYVINARSYCPKLMQFTCYTHAQSCKIESCVSTIAIQLPKVDKNIVITVEWPCSN